ncbi:hypothetical protein [Marinobacter sp.]|uniref:hypothetical protein n=1 Tax=Marinobacter sp. TaxID=50741 RepID=UPI0035621725
MTLEELVNRVNVSPDQSVPDWMLGCFRRRCISFANGESDNQTIVYWLQSRNFTIDLRLPRVADQVRPAPLEDYRAGDLDVLAGYEGWMAPCEWADRKLSWYGGTALQLTNRWPEPAELRRVGNCMVEFAPSGAYVEDWRLQPSSPGPLVGLRLLEEYDPQTGQRFARGGGLIICGDYAARVLGRPAPLTESHSSLAEMAVSAEGSREHLTALFDFETSVASGSLAQGYTVEHSTQPGRVGLPLLEEGSFRWDEDLGRVEQTFSHDDQNRIRIFEVDVIEPNREFALNTPASAAAEAWFLGESDTLRRYTGVMT